MTKLFCDYCSSQLFEDERNCPRCGAPTRWAIRIIDDDDEDDYVPTKELPVVYTKPSGTHAILMLNHVIASDIDMYNKSVVCNFKDLDNGSVVQIGNKYGSGYEVCEVLRNKTCLLDLWMIHSPEIVCINSGNTSYRSFGNDPDPSCFYNVKGMIMDGFKPCKGDILSISSYSIIGKRSDYICACDKDERLHWSNSPYNDRLTFKKIDEVPLVLSGGKIPSIKMQVVCA
jgi:hypothetical protein